MKTNICIPMNMAQLRVLNRLAHLVMTNSNLKRITVMNFNQLIIRSRKGLVILMWRAMDHSLKKWKKRFQVLRKQKKVKKNDIEVLDNKGKGQDQDRDLSTLLETEILVLTKTMNKFQISIVDMNQTGVDTKSRTNQ